MQKTSKQTKIDKLENYKGGDSLSERPMGDYLESLTSNEGNFIFICIYDHRTHTKKNQSIQQTIQQMKKLIAEDYDAGVKYDMPEPPEWYLELSRKYGIINY